MLIKIRERRRETQKIQGRKWECSPFLKLRNSKKRYVFPVLVYEKVSCKESKEPRRKEVQKLTFPFLPPLLKEYYGKEKKPKTKIIN